MFEDFELFGDLGSMMVDFDEQKKKPKHEHEKAKLKAQTCEKIE